jgi:hypothetical protein
VANRVDVSFWFTALKPAEAGDPVVIILPSMILPRLGALNGS